MIKKSLLLLLCLFLFGSGRAQNNNIKESLDSLLNYLGKSDGFSGRVCIQKYNQPVYTGSIGKMNSGTGRYKVGSVSKVFTAILTYQLIDEGKLTLQIKLSKYFPEIKYADQITIANLLSHSSGIFSVTDWEDYYSNRTKNFSRKDLIDLVVKHKPSFKPNTDCSYSNTNYILLGFIIEDITGKSFNMNLQERIVSKMGSNNTYCETSGGTYPARESSYKFNGENWNKDIDSDPSLPFAAGAIVSTAEDLCKMMYLLAYQHLISDSMFTRMKILRYRATGHGLFRAPFYDKEGWGHTGRIDEFRSFVLYIPQDSLILGITTNAMNMKLNDMSIGLLSAYYGRKYTYPVFTKTDTIDPPTQIFHGTYKARLFRIIPVGKLSISQAGFNHLYLSEASDKQDVEKSLVVRKGAYTFYSPEAGGQLIFIPNKKGKITKMHLKQGNITIRCKRKK